MGCLPHPPQPRIKPAPGVYRLMLQPHEPPAQGKADNGEKACDTGQGLLNKPEVRAPVLTLMLTDGIIPGHSPTGLLVTAA